MIQTRLTGQPGRAPIFLYSTHTLDRLFSRHLPRAFAAFLFCLSFLAFSAGSALAYNPSQSMAEVRLHGDHFEFNVQMDLETAWIAMGGSPDAPPDMAGSMPRARKYAAEVYRISTADGWSLKPTEATAEYREAEGGVTFRSIFSRPDAGTLRFDAPFLARIPHYHKATVVMWDERNKRVGWTALETSHPSGTLLLPADTTGPTYSFWGYVKLGIGDFLMGYGHVPFLCALLVVCRRLSSTVAILLGFTVAHMLSLALVALHVVTVSSRTADLLIAASIAIVCLDNVVRRGDPTARWILATILGLAHGLGLGNALREEGLGASWLAKLGSLSSFTLGVELEQVAALVVVLLVLFGLRTRSTFERYGVPVTSALVAVLSGYWLMRTTDFVAS
jgi:hypothetical protein